MTNYCIVDLESVADESVIPLLKPPRAAKNLKDPAKIAADVAEKTAAQLEGLSLDPAGCRIVALGWDGVVHAALNTEQESYDLNHFWSTVAGRTLVGYNCIAFDLPVLLTRSRILGVSTPHYDVKKWGCQGVIDLMLDLSFNGLVDYKSLGFWCKRLGLDVPDDESTGADIAGMVARGEWDRVKHHCLADITKIEALFKRLYPHAI